MQVGWRSDLRTDLSSGDEAAAAGRRGLRVDDGLRGGRRGVVVEGGWSGRAAGHWWRRRKFSGTAEGIHLKDM